MEGHQRTPSSSLSFQFLIFIRKPIVINGPELLSKYVGQAEENLRETFRPAEEDQAENGEDADLHIIIFDEIDALMKVSWEFEES